MVLRLLLSLVAVARLSVGSDPSCDLECHQNAQCVFGSADFSDHPAGPDGKPLEIHAESNSQGMHCACPPGWTGLTCLRIYESCDEDHKCYNGGKCIPGLNDYFGNQQLFCDCSDARNEEGERFVGKFCEHPQFDTCDTSGLFCVNGGECNPAFPDDPQGGPCNCEEGYEGAHCEFKKGSVPPCDLECINGGVCQLGMTDITQFHDLEHLYNGTDTPFKKCVCPEGYGGSFCEISRQRCGSHHCYNGGTCISRDDINGITKYHCDCTTAHDSHGSYAGRFCQFESSSFCTKLPDQNGQLFCVNGGTCKDESHQGCDCPEGFVGPSCEFKTTPAPADTIPPTDPPTLPPIFPGPSPSPTDPLPTDPPAAIPESVPSTCSLMCENGGVCRKGSKDLGVVSHLAPYVSHLNKTFDENFEHCVCPKGFVGLTCEHRIEICPESEHVCLHGAKCVKYGDEAACNCEDAQTDFGSHFAGKSCEHHATEICTIGALLPGRPRSFCVNGGACKAKVSSEQPPPGCFCDPDWTGPHCELARANVEATSPVLPEPLPPPHAADSHPANGTSSPSENRGFISFVLVMSILALIAATAIFVVTCRRHRLMQQRAEQETAQSNLGFSMPSQKYSDNPRGRSFRDGSFRQQPSAQSINLALGEREDEAFVNVGPPRDEDGHELHNVELL